MKRKMKMIVMMINPWLTQDEEMAEYDTKLAEIFKQKQLEKSKKKGNNSLFMPNYNILYLSLITLVYQI